MICVLIKRENLDTHVYGGVPREDEGRDLQAKELLMIATKLPEAKKSRTDFPLIVFRRNQTC